MLSITLHKLATEKIHFFDIPDYFTNSKNRNFRMNAVHIDEKFKANENISNKWVK